MAASLTSTDLTLGNTSGASIPGTPSAGQTVIYPKDDKLLYYKDDAGVERSANINLGTAVATTSGTSIDFTGIPAGVKRVTINYKGISTNGTAYLRVQLGTSGGIETSGYVGSADTSVSTTNTLFSDSFNVGRNWTAAHFYSGSTVLSLGNASTFTWMCLSSIGNESSGEILGAAGAKSLSAGLTQLRITAGGSNTFDAGSVNISWEF